jgi:hypothetical protein
MLLWILVLLFLLLAIGGGIIVSKILFFLLILAIVVAHMGAYNRSTIGRPVRCERRRPAGPARRSPAIRGVQDAFVRRGRSAALLRRPLRDESQLGSRLLVVLLRARTDVARPHQPSTGPAASWEARAREHAGLDSVREHHARRSEADEPDRGLSNHSLRASRMGPAPKPLRFSAARRGNPRDMLKRRYALLGWLVWMFGKRRIRQKLRVAGR